DRRTSRRTCRARGALAAVRWPGGVLAGCRRRRGDSPATVALVAGLGAAGCPAAGLARRCRWPDLRRTPGLAAGRDRRLAGRIRLARRAENCAALVAPESGVP